MLLQKKSLLNVLTGLLKKCHGPTEPFRRCFMPFWLREDFIERLYFQIWGNLYIIDRVNLGEKGSAVFIIWAT